MKDKVITGTALYHLEANAQSVIAHIMFDEMKHYKENPNSGHIVLKLINLAISANCRASAAIMLSELNEMVNHYEDYGWNDINCEDWNTQNNHRDFQSARQKLIEYFFPKEDNESEIHCEHCGSKDVSLNSYHYLETNELEYSECDEWTYCGDCQDSTNLISLNEWRDKAHGKQSKNT